TAQVGTQQDELARQFNRAQKLLKSGAYAQAESGYARLYARLPGPARATVHNNQAWAQLQQDAKPDEAAVRAAKNQLIRALSLDPDNDLARYNLELLLRRYPPPPSPPPPPATEVPESPQPQTLPTEGNGKRATYESQSLDDIEAMMQRLAKEKIQYFHQARKDVARTTPDGRDPAYQPW
ncbi:MAG: hypothetical protein ACK5X3_11360, partial [Pseudomonadota bacterium]